MLRQSADGFWVGIFGSGPIISQGELNAGAAGLPFFELRLSFLWLGLRISCHGHGNFSRRLRFFEVSLRLGAARTDYFLIQTDDWPCGSPKEVGFFALIEKIIPACRCRTLPERGQSRLRLCLLFLGRSLEGFDSSLTEGRAKVDRLGGLRPRPDTRGTYSV